MKFCDGCGESKVIWKNSGGKKYCQRCWSANSVKTKPKPTVRQKKLSPRSPKRNLQEAEYSVKRKQFLNNNPMCQVHLSNICTQYANQVHHKKGRIGDLLNDDTFWLAICGACHSWVELNPIEAKELNLSVNRN